MDIKEIKEKKDLLEDAIIQLLIEFEKSTTLNISDIVIQRTSHRSLHNLMPTPSILQNIEIRINI
jgi:hypothetical protein